MIFTLLTGILGAALLFSATLWCFAQVFMAQGHARIACGICAALIIACMGTISLESPVLGLVSGIALIAAGLAAAYLTKGFARLFPLSASGFGLILALGIPFTG